MGIEELRTAPRSLRQNACAERLIGSIRRECLDHIIVINERGLRRALAAYIEYCLCAAASSRRPPRPNPSACNRWTVRRQTRSPLRL